MNVSDEGRAPERFNGAFMSANAFRLIGQPPLLGRDFLPEDDRPGAAAVVLLGNGVWKNRYGSDPASSAGRSGSTTCPSVVIGVMPEGFKFPQNADLWQPLSLVPDLEQQKRNARGLEVFGRLAPGVSREQAQAELLAIGQRLTHDYPDTNKDVQPNVQTFNERSQRRADPRDLPLADGRGGFVLLIACANVANLLLARSAHRSREISVRVSIGATRWRIVRQLLIESVLLALIGGVLGLGASISRHPTLRCRDAGCRQALLDSVHDGRPRLRVPRGDLSRHRRHLRARAGAPCLEDRRQRDPEGRRTLGIGRHRASAAGRRAHHRGAGA